MRRLSEDQTRKQLIDPQLEKAGWYLRDHSKVKIEVPVGVQIDDYRLYRESMERL